MAPSSSALEVCPTFDASGRPVASLAAAWSAVLELERAEDEGTALDLLHKAAGLLGADAACFLTGILETPPNRWNYRMLAACDAAWASEYIRQRRFAQDPWLKFARSSVEPVLASRLFVDSAGLETVLAATEAGMRSVWVLPAPSPFGTNFVSALYLASSEVDFFESQPDLSQQVKLLGWALALQLQLWLRTRLQAELIATSGLTERDIQLLRHEDRRQGSKAIARTFSTEGKTIDSRFQRVNAKLGVANRRQAWRVAKIYGVI